MWKTRSGQSSPEAVAIILLATLCFGIHLALKQQEKRAEAERVAALQDEGLKPRDAYFESIGQSSLERPRQGDIRPLDDQGKRIIPDLEQGPEGLVEVYPKPIARYMRMFPGTDGTMRAPNAYLVHYAPFVTDDPWTPMVAVSYRLKYAFDAEAYWRSDAWETSREAWRLMRGDCEDHAILLADWLIQMGYDARVVLGLWNSNPHAWVVLVYDGKEYLLESVEKALTRKIPPLTTFDLAHSPEFMFNQEAFWVNRGTYVMASYSSAQWKKTAEFEDSPP